ncbi:ABC transporter permease [Paenibacillus piri]|uniref:Sugar ABC transporter permease n=1 Tax=Paenibacillus piri TaxID=2547395 RepID=A0A4R5KSP9_9BACL|nr:ABC transporter permease subunit [Paenibacillus piri]TDF98078.1 sugar ABC transporter permease [Paenibacillus piri]
MKAALQQTDVPISGIKAKRKWNLRKNWPLHILVLPAFILVFIFQYAPLPGLVMAFQNFKPYLGFMNSPWVGMEQFNKLIEFPETRQVIVNTFIIASLKIVFHLIVPFVFALLLNEVRVIWYKRVVQTFVYLPHFLSWVILGGILLDMLSTDGGLVNNMLTSVFGIEPVFFLGDGNWFRITVIASDIWKDFGFATIVFLAALAGVDPSLYEAATIDGANRFQQVLYITIPSLIPIAIVVGTLSLGNILNAGFDQIFNLYNPMVYEKGDIIDTYVYRVGLIAGDFGFGTAVGMFKSVISFVLIIIAYRLAYRFANYRIF